MPVARYDAVEEQDILAVIDTDFNTEERTVDAKL